MSNKVEVPGEVEQDRALNKAAKENKELQQEITRLGQMLEERNRGMQSDRALIEKLQAENRLHRQYARIIQAITHNQTPFFERI